METASEYWSTEMKSTLTFLTALLLAPLAALRADERPNVLLITADDLGCQLSCYGEKRFETPRRNRANCRRSRPAPTWSFTFPKAN